MKKNALHLEGEAKKLAPVKEGTLQGDIQMNPQVIETLFKHEFESQVHAGTGQSAAYALRIHEEMKPEGDDFEQGDITKDRPNSAVGEPGGGYLTRPLVHFSDFYQEAIAKALRKLK